FNYHAGLKAMNTMAMDNANHFFGAARELFPGDSWEGNYDFLFALHKNLARTEMATGNQRQSEAIVNTLLEKATSDLDKADCLYEQTAGLSSMGIFRNAIDLGNRGLDYFGRRIPDDDDEALKRSAEIIEEIHRDDADIWQAILDVAPSDHRATKIETAIYSELIPDYYLAGMVPQLYLSAIQSTQNCLAGGVDESVIYGFSMVGLYLQRQDRYDMSYRYEDLGIALAHRYPNTFGATKGINGILWTNMHNRSKTEHVIDQCQENIHRGKSCGDLYNAGLSYGPLIWNMIARGDDLTKVASVADECVSFSEKFNLSLSLGLARSALVGWSAPMQMEREPPKAKEIDVLLETWEQASHVVSIGGYHTLKGISSFYLGDHAESARSLKRATPYLRGLSDNILNRLWYVFSFVNTLRLSHQQPAGPELAHWLERVTRWAALGPILKPYLALMHAEQRLAEQRADKGHFGAARSALHEAIDSSHDAGYTMLQGHLHESLGHLLTAHSRPYAAESFERATHLYEACGATAKAHELQASRAMPRVQDTPGGISPGLERTPDVEYLFRASRAISQELDASVAQQVIMTSIMERIGATDGFLFRIEGDRLVLSVRGSKERGHVRVSTDEKELQAAPMSMAIVRLASRSQQMINLPDAQNDQAFVHDPQIRQWNIRAVLCQPIVHQQRRLGVLYLQNTLLANAFDPKASELVRLLSTQAAISLQNAELYQQLMDSQRLLLKAEDLAQLGSWELQIASGELQLSENFQHMLQGNGLPSVRTLEQMTMLFSEPDREPLRRALSAVMEGTPCEAEFHLAPKPGRRRTVTLHVELERDEHDRPWRVHGIIRDVTEIRRSEESLRQAQKMEAIALLAGGAQDFDDMLVPILGYAESLTAGPTPEGPMNIAPQPIKHSMSRPKDVFGAETLLKKIGDVLGKGKDR
ncbi:MAG: GAF domain-containing protein, partial [Deltaproteobacteria bacterium]|nr:GAF domain-containing protein [Deltaproteobacteria bacterium]